MVSKICGLVGSQLWTNNSSQTTGWETLCQSTVRWMKQIVKSKFPTAMNKDGTTILFL
jgi:hypothetical protein